MTTADATLPAETISPQPGDQVIDPGGAVGTLPDPALAQKIERAASSAVDQHLGSRRGKRGPDKKPRKPREQSVPLENLGNGTPETLLEEGTPAPLEGIIPDAPTFDEETAREMVEISLGLLNDGAAAIVRAIAKKETGDEQLAIEAGDSVRMGEKIEKTVRTGAIKCAKKYAVRLDYAPEIMLGGGLLVWAGQVKLAVNALKAKGAELRKKEGNK